MSAPRPWEQPLEAFRDARQVVSKGRLSVVLGVTRRVRNEGLQHVMANVNWPTSFHIPPPRPERSG